MKLHKTSKRHRGCIITLLGVSLTSGVGATDYTITVSDADRDITAAELYDITNSESTVTRVIKKGAKKLNLREPMPDYKGSWRINEGQLHVYAATNGVGAAGDGTDEIYIYGQSHPLVLHGTVIEKKITCYGTWDASTDGVWCYGENRVTKGFSVSSGWLPVCLFSGSTLYTDGGVSVPGNYRAVMTAAGETHWYWRDVESSVNFLQANLVHIHIQCGGNTFNTIQPYNGGIIRVEHADAFSGKMPNVSYGQNSGNSGTLDLNRGRHAFSNLLANASITRNAILTGSAGTGASFTQTDPFTNTVVQFTGAFDFTKKGPALMAINRTIATSGALAVEEGCLELMPNCTWKNTSQVTVGGTGVLSLSRSDVFKTGVRLDLNGEARNELELAEDVSVTVAELYVNGVRQPSGIYGGPESGAEHSGTGRFVGKGVVCVAPAETVEPETVAVTWDAGGGADTSVATAANWVGDPADLDLSSGGLLPTFATAGEMATVASAVAFKGIVFDPPSIPGATSNAFQVAASGGSPRIDLGSLGISATATPANGLKGWYTIGAPLQLTASQTWQIPTADTAQLDITSPISGTDNWTLTKDGTGALNLRGDNSSFTGPIEILNGTVNVYGTNALGSSDWPVTVYEDNSGKGVNGAMAIRTSGDINRPIILMTNYKQGKLTWWGKVTHRHTKPFTIIANSQSSSQMYLQDGGTLYSEAGVDFTKSSTFGVTTSGGGLWVIRNKPMKGGTFILMWMGMRFDAPGNKLNTFAMGADTSAYLQFGCDWAFDNTNMTLGVTSSAAQWQSGGYIDLMGHSQRIGSFTVNGTGTLRSSTGAATLYFTQTSAAVTNGTSYRSIPITGGISLSKAGDKTYCIDRTIASTGSVEVTEGRFAFGPNAEWRGAPSIRAAGTGILEINKSGTFRKPETYIDGDGKIEIAEGVVQHVHNLWIDGSPATASGTYGSSASAAQYKDDEHFSGKGVLHVHSSFSGGILILR